MELQNYINRIKIWCETHRSLGLKLGRITCEIKWTHARDSKSQDASIWKTVIKKDSLNSWRGNMTLEWLHLFTDVLKLLHEGNIYKCISTMSCILLNEGPKPASGHTHVSTISQLLLLVSALYCSSAVCNTLTHTWKKPRVWPFRHLYTWLSPNTDTNQQYLPIERLRMYYIYLNGFFYCNPN